MGLSHSIAPPSSRDIARSRWPVPLQNASVPLLTAYYTAFTELPSAIVTVKDLGSTIGLCDADLRILAEVWDNNVNINVWELLMALTLTSHALTLRTKVAFVFRLCDANQNQRLDGEEFTLMLGIFVRGLGAYCRWPTERQPKLQAIKDYVRKTFPIDVTEAEFAKWVSRQPILCATLRAFTPQRPGMTDCLDFELHNAATRCHPGTQEHSAVSCLLAPEGRKNSKPEPGLSPVEGRKNSKPEPGLSPVEWRKNSKPEPGLSPVGTLPPVLPKAPENVIQNFPSVPKAQGYHVAASVPKAQGYHVDPEFRGRRRSAPSVMSETKGYVELGQATSGLTPRRRASLNITLPVLPEKDNRCCALHRGTSSSCVNLSKHEIWMSNMLWRTLREQKEKAHASAVHRNLGKMAKQMHDDGCESSLTHIYDLTNVKHNPLFGFCVSRMRAGADISFRDFLHALWPCASNPQLDRWEHFDMGSRSDEEEFVSFVEDWLDNSSAHWKKPVLHPKVRARYEAEMKSLDADGDGKLSVEEISYGANMAMEDAEDLMSRHDLDGDGLLNLNEFIEFRCPETWRARGDSDFELALYENFQSIIKSWAAGKPSEPTSSPRTTQKVFRSVDADGDGYLSIDEITGYVDAGTARELLEMYDTNSDGRLSLKEFAAMLGCLSAKKKDDMNDEAVHSDEKVAVLS